MADSASFFLPRESIRLAARRVHGSGDLSSDCFSTMRSRNASRVSSRDVPLNSGAAQRNLGDVFSINRSWSGRSRSG